MIPEIKKILFTTNLTRSSQHAFNYAVSIAGRYGASITLLHVMEEVSRTADVRLKDFLGEEKWQEIKGSYEQHAREVLIGKKKEALVIREALDEFTEKAKEDLGDIDIVTDEIVVVSGNVVDEILSEAQRRDCDLIVMGYHVRGKLEEAVLGSTYRKVLRRSKIPVMLVPLPEEEE